MRVGLGTAHLGLNGPFCATGGRTEREEPLTLARVLKGKEEETRFLKPPDHHKYKGNAFKSTLPQRYIVSVSDPKILALSIQDGI